MRTLRFALCASAALLMAAAAEAQQKRFRGWTGPKPQVDCQCRHVDGRAELGETVCLRRGDKLVTARCEKRNNLPFWKLLDQSCGATS